MDLSLVELRIRALPGVVACQFTATTALVLVGPDGDGDAVRAAVTAVLDQAASNLSVDVLAVPTRAAVIPLWRRRKTALALAGSAAALSATVAAAATISVVPDSPRRPAAELTAPLVLTPTKPAKPASPVSPASQVPRDSGSMLGVAIELASSSEPAVSAPSAPVNAPVLLEVPLPRPLVAAASAPSRPPAVPTAVPTTASVPVVSALSATTDTADAPPRGRARRVRAAFERVERAEHAEHLGPAPEASPVATNEGSRHDEFELRLPGEKKTPKD